ncbi:MAG: hypothetical protein IKJ01_05020 [Lachnospiraceae bacterium]|nr:hypothetical protein [Lachnospiraceae bacterium]
MATIESYTRVETKIDENGNERINIIESTKKREKLTEPDYIKLYTPIWKDNNQIPKAYKLLFINLATYMSYCNKSDLRNTQLVNIMLYGDKICQDMGWKSKDSLMKGLKVLCKCGALYRVKRGFYQINPLYIGKGEWKYNPKYNRGGIEDYLNIFTTNLQNKNIITQTVWADNGKDTEQNQFFREMLGQNNNATLTYCEISSTESFNEENNNI